MCACASVAPGHALRQQPFLTDLEAQLGTAEGGAAAVAALAALRAVLLQPQRMNVFVAGDLTKLPTPHAALAAALRPPSGAPAAAAAPAAAGPISGVEQHRLLSGREAQVVAATRAVTGTRCAMHHAPPCTTMHHHAPPCGAPPRDAPRNTRLAQLLQVVVASLSAVETHFLTASAPGLAPYSPDHASLLVAIEHLTALEGDFWVKLRGAGLTYSYSIRVSVGFRHGLGCVGGGGLEGVGGGRGGLGLG